jgi:L-ribulose-5-phosphate 3-epimerase UlaE
MSFVLRRLASPCLKVIYDPVNLIPNAGLGGLFQSQKDFFAEAFAAFGDEIAAIHAKDFRMGAGGTSGAVVKNGTLPAGTGELDYQSLLSLTAERKPGIDILLENSSPDTGKQAIAFLNSFSL